ncbi:hypothetical protein [Malonomonas rubra]|uniref:hypothetical protein n=1 Tax=Malonomonas rubra TaxID=57040 RepID=UPI0026EEE0F0|nr:hypothetical protein [Malonomonas rubra]
MPAWRRVWLLVVTLLLALSCLATAGPYTDSAHGNTTTGVDRSSIDARYSTFIKGNCSHCHEQHSSLGGSEPLPVGSAHNPALRFAPEEHLCNICHDGSPVSKNIASEFNKQYRHPVTDYADRHTLSLDEKGQNGAPFRGLNRHAECSDCHEPHTAQGALHIAPGNDVSGMLLGVWGVEPNSDLRWQPALSFREESPATKEYQLCFKCHSGYALWEVDGIANFTGPSGVLITDQAMEFSKANRSAHPVRIGMNYQTGSYGTRSLSRDKMKAPWNLTIGEQTMYCSDCHDTDSSTVAGPHASANRFLLQGSWTWPYRPIDGKLWTLNDVRSNINSWNSRLLCAKCHSLNFNDMSDEHPHLKTGHTSNYGAEPYTTYDSSFSCVACHIPIPHGSAVSRLIGYDTLPEPYKITVSTGATFPVLRQFKKEQVYSKRSCFVPNTAACHSAHTIKVDGAD